MAVELAADDVAARRKEEVAMKRAVCPRVATGCALHGAVCPRVATGCALHGAVCPRVALKLRIGFVSGASASSLRETAVRKP